MEFLAEENDCGQTLLRLVSRGSAIIAELLRLSQNIPGVFMGPSHVEDPEQLKYLNILFDFAYLKSAEDFENMVNSNTELLDIDDEFMDNHADILDRFYQLFDGIYKYVSDYLEFLDNLEKGFFIQHTLTNILLDTDGAQLMCEALYLYGVILLLLDRKIPGPSREKMVIAYYRSKGASELENIDEVCKLCRVTGYLPGQPKPPQYPERYFKRFAPPEEVVSMVIGKLQSDDVYLQEPSFPHRNHRSTRLAAQASMLFVILYFAPDILIHEKASMREIVDRHFNDNFIITTYMGAVADLSMEWAAYPAARLALANTLEPSNIAHITKKKAQQTQKSIDELNYFLTEGVLTDQYVLENLDPLLNSIRHANVTIRWTFLHSRIQPVIPMMNNAKEQREIFDHGTDPDKLITLLLKVSQLEWKLKQMFVMLLDTKEERWQRCMKETSERMVELSEYFSGEKPLTRVERNEDLMNWFKDLAEKVNSLDYVDHIKAGRRIKRLIEALGHVEQFDQIDTNLQVKAYLEESREFLTEMVRTVRIRDEVMAIIENVSDLSYAWEIINDFMRILHQRVKNDPSSVILLRAMFLKLASILDVPLTRIHQCGSGDVISVAEYYSGELVDYVRRVMEVIPQSVFRILAGIIKLQTDHMKPIPVKFENTLLKNHAQLNERYRLARATNEVSKYTEGILAMKRTLLGIIEVDPRLVLEDGLRKELVYRVSKAFHDTLIFEKSTSEECHEIFIELASTLDAYRLSFEYIQDYINIYGLRMWHEELSRIINYNVEQECNRYLKKKVYDRASQYQSRAIPIPRFQPPTGDMSVNFMGRLMHALFIMTDPHTTIYSPQCIGWFSADGKEVCGISAFSVLHKSVGLLGLAGLDRMLSFRIVHTLNNLVKFWGTAVTPYYPLLDQLSTALTPEWKIPEHSSRLYDAALKKVEKIMSKLLKAVLIIGQAALIRRQISSELSFSSRLDANLLSCTLDALNQSLLNDIRAHYRDPRNKPYPGSDGNPILVELNKYLENIGANDPFQKIYITVDAPLDGLAAMFMLFVIAYMPKLQYDRNFGALARVGKNPIDGQPLLLGILTIFKQFHPSYTDKFLSYLGQYVRSKVTDTFTIENQKGKLTNVTELPVEVVNTLIFMQELARCAKIQRSFLEGLVPAYMFDAIQV
ncbi:hypothetical protein Poli38472_006164 [Pythium oligandrum]|uniref:Strumpellin n=1 Tax=Pythium oligandrum TaxID=41045 RepID=A0A8K1CU66_PYTOL|nr:hypothetical protein Poli38472_006164 [Pythium oligandrum]|eukprot:TMW68696.1 hypothetical protein Poli38472_006164 [Pythium oligandrum]